MVDCEIKTNMNNDFKIISQLFSIGFSVKQYFFLMQGVFRKHLDNIFFIKKQSIRKLKGQRYTNADSKCSLNAWFHMKTP